MFTARVLFGTESGNAEMVADDVAAALGERGLTVSPEELSDVAVDSLEAGQFVFLICSTYEEGQLPESAQPFYESIREQSPDLGGVHYFAFGLGDSSYEFFSNGIDTLSDALTAAGAIQMSETIKHDALSGTDPAELGVEWALASFDSVAASPVR